MRWASTCRWFVADVGRGQRVWESVNTIKVLQEGERPGGEVESG